MLIEGFSHPASCEHKRPQLRRGHRVASPVRQRSLRLGQQRCLGCRQVTCRQVVAKLGAAKDDPTPADEATAARLNHAVRSSVTAKPSHRIAMAWGVQIYTPAKRIGNVADQPPSSVTELGRFAIDISVLSRRGLCRINRREKNLRSPFVVTTVGVRSGYQKLNLKPSWTLRGKLP
jgi:hypothetical protein